HHGLHDDETAERCHWHLPATHPLEAWSDVRAIDGTVSIVQPLIAPLWGGRSAHEVLAAFTGEAGKSGHDLVQEHWKRALGEADFERRWQRALHDGAVAGTAFAARAATPRLGEWARRPTTTTSPTPPGPGALDVVFRTDPGTFDGRFANNGW